MIVPEAGLCEGSAHGNWELGTLTEPGEDGGSFFLGSYQMTHMGDGKVRWVHKHTVTWTKEEEAQK